MLSVLNRLHLSNSHTLRISCQHDISPLRKRPPDTFVRLTSHEDCLSLCERFETFELLRNMPRKLISLPDDTIFRHRDDAGYFWGMTHKMSIAIHSQR